MDKKLLFIYNPKSGKTQIKSRLSDILDIFVKQGYLVTVYPTQKSRDALRISRELGGDYDRVVCSGGDGTLDEVITGLMQGGHKLPVGYIPSGSTNDFGNSLGIPKDMLQAAGTAVTGKEFACDLGSFNDGIFVYIAAFGLFTDVSYETNQQMKNVLGHVAYLLEGMKRIPQVRTYKLTFTYDDARIEDEFIFGMITNSVSVGGFKRITGENVVLDDGVFEVTLIKKPSNAIELNRVITSLMNQDIDSECMYCFQTDHLTVEAEEDIPWTLDGEYGGNPKKIEICNLRRAQVIMVPPRDKEI